MRRSQVVTLIASDARRAALASSLSLFLTTVGFGAADAQCPASDLFEPAAAIGQSGAPVKAADVNEDGILDLALGAETLGDFNTDGILDVVVRGGVTIRFGEGVNGVGAGYFAGPESFYMPGAAGDSLTLLFGQGENGIGNGAVGNGRRFYVPRFGMSGTSSIESADFNEDGILDLVVADPSCCDPDSAAFFVLIGQGSGGAADGTFAPAVAYRNADNQIYDVGVSDLNGDGILDVIAVSYAAVWVFAGLGSSGIGDGTFGPAVGYLTNHYTSAPNLVIDDFLEDGAPDIVVGVGNFGTPGIVLLRGRPDGTFAQAISFGLGGSSSPSFIATADLNHDGIRDIVAGISQQSSGLSILTGLGSNGVGNGTFSGPTFVPDLLAAGISSVIADFNADGMLDLVLSSPSLAMFFGRCPPREAAAPTLMDVRDVRADQGGFVAVSWASSPLDRAGPRRIVGYTVWRRLANFKPASNDPTVIRKGPGDLASTATYWEPIATLPAQYLDGYGYTASTPTDSMPGSNPYTAFFVTALTDDPFLFFESEVDSGYSVDNLSPTLPKGVRGFLIPENGDLVLHWRPNAEPDLHHYNVYRGHSPGFDALPSTLIASPTDTMYVDTDFGVSTFYRVSAVDIHGNESRPPVPVSAGEASLGAPHLYPAFVPSGVAPVEIRYVLGPRTASMRLELFDVAGGRVRVLDSGTRPPGEYRQLWNRRNDAGIAVARGIYIARLTSGGHRLTQKIVLLRQ